MKVLVTTGNTQTPIDEVRCITNIFTGRTGTGIALEAESRGHEVTLLTSHPEMVPETRHGQSAARLAVHVYRTFDDLERLMAEHIPNGYDAVVHCAAVSDYAVAGVLVPDAKTQFDTAAGTWRSAGDAPRLLDAYRGKVKSRHAEAWLRLTPTPKLVDRIREPWGFDGVLVKFKLEVDVSEEQLRIVADESRRQSRADLMVANTLDGHQAWALLGPIGGRYERISRAEMARRLLDEVECLQLRKSGS